MIAEKTCAGCGRRIEWRRKWRGCWNEIEFCSAACRRRGRPDEAVESAILDLLGQRSKGATICPSEVARACFPGGWRERMEDVRRAARCLVARGKVEITQNGRVVDPSAARGPIRIRRVD